MFLYSIVIWLYACCVKLASLFNPKARLMVKGHRGVFERLKQSVTGKPVIWIHAASLGEFEQGRPLIEVLRARYPEYMILLTFFSPSGYEIRKNYDKADHICYLPFDTPRNARKFVDIVRPEITIFVKYEFWLNYLKTLRKGGYRTFIVSAIFRKNSVFFKPYGKIFRNGLTTFERLFVQDNNSLKLLKGIGINNVTVAGDTRFDRVSDIVSSAKTIKPIENFIGLSKVFVAGSSWEPDEKLIVELAAKYPETKYIIVPHEIGEHHISILLNSFPDGSAVLYTKSDEETDFSKANVMIVDTIGLLSSIYRYADVAYIGGGFGAGIHNILEAATFGLPIAFGPNYGKFREAHEMINIGAARSVGNSEELVKWYSEMTDNPTLYAQAKAKALSYISYNTGATEKIMAYLTSEVR